MLHVLKRAEHYRDLAKRYLRLAAISHPTKNRNHYLRIAQQYNTLAEAEELRTLGTRMVLAASARNSLCSINRRSPPGRVRGR